MPHGTRRSIIALLAIASFTSTALAQTDAAPSGKPLFTSRDLLLAGGVVGATLLVRPADEHYARRLQDSSTQANAKLHTLALFVRTTAAPGALVIGTTMYAAGRIAKSDRMAQLGLHGTEALLLGEVTGGVIKGLVGRQRPYVKPQNSHSFGFLRGFAGGDQYRSFPSGHTLAAFAAAASVTSETAGWWPSSTWIIGPAMYGGAALAGVSRMYDNRHWASDVIVGAGLGTFAGLKVVRYHRAHPHTGFDRWLLTGSLIPTESGGHALHWSILPDLSPGRVPQPR
jgi:membrane-associated phospholipid phosphatase